MAIADSTIYTIEAYNISHASENKIHDDTIAKKLGFTGGLVPGVEVFAYATHPAVAKWGRAWLERGRMEARFLKPVYDGRMATVTAQSSGAGLALKVTSDDVLCATGEASLPDGPSASPAIASYAMLQPPEIAARPPADEISLAEGKVLCSRPTHVTAQVASDYLRDIREAAPIYAAEGIAHPGLLLRQCNMALRDNVLLPPWIHTGSKLRNFSAAKVGETLTVRSRVTANYERKGHRLVDMDCIVLADGERVLAQVLHTAVYKLRHLNAA
jgi:acyl dehydratase